MSDAVWICTWVAAVMQLQGGETLGGWVPSGVFMCTSTAHPGVRVWQAVCVEEGSVRGVDVLTRATDAGLKYFYRDLVRHLVFNAATLLIIVVVGTRRVTASGCLVSDVVFAVPQIKEFE